MGISVISGGLTLEDLKELLKTDSIQIGTETVGFVIHNEPGTTKDGVDVDAQFWIEIYGEEIHFSEV